MLSLFINFYHLSSFLSILFPIIKFVAISNNAQPNSTGYISLAQNGNNAIPSTIINKLYEIPSAIRNLIYFHPPLYSLRQPRAAVIRSITYSMYMNMYMLNGGYAGGHTGEHTGEDKGIGWATIKYPLTNGWITVE